MPRTVGRRALFFAALALLSLLLYYPTPSDFRWVCLFSASLGGFWAVALALEDLTGPSAPPRQRPVQPTAESESPFAPPPPPGGGASS
ncbi:MAG TPA: hypothetical protein VGA30_06625 [Actinomycetota bacterium]